MKIACRCGASVFDSADGLPDKAHLIPDQAWLKVNDGIDDEVVDALAAAKISVERAYMKFRQILSAPARLMWQCKACGRLYIDDAGGELQCYLPESPGTNKEILRSSIADNDRLDV